MKISIVLITYTQLDLVRQCLEHIKKYAGVLYELIIINNGSNIDTIKYLQQQQNIKLFLHSENIGIARSYNQGWRESGGDYILLINQYSLLTEECLSSMLQCLQTNEKAAMAGPVSNDVSGYQRISVPYKDLNDLDHFARQNRIKNVGRSQQTSRLLSHCLLVKKDAIEILDGFDECFGLETYEDDDLCLRAVNAGYTLHIALDAFVHYVNPLALPMADIAKYYSILQQNKQKAINKWGFDIADYLLTLTIPITISLCMIARNEEKVLARCLDCIKDIVDEIIIVDTGSDDRTKAIARQYTDRIYDFPWIDDFAAARNFAFQQATREYILWLDADDVLAEEDQKKLLSLKQNLDPSVDSFTMNYYLAFDQHGNVVSSNRRNRLVKRSNNFQWIGAVHEYLAVYGKIVDSDMAVIHKSEWHDSERNLSIYEKRLNAGETFSPRDQYYYANELLDHKQYNRAAEWYQVFLKGGQGWVEDNIAACRKTADCYFQLGDSDNALKYIFQSFIYDNPRAEFCCQLGYHFLNAGRFKEAAFWYKLATQLEKPIDSRGFINHACWTWIPHLQLCVCYDQLGKYELAYEHNEMAASFIPDDERIKSNREYLKKRLSRG
jgi:Predicted glycosyltransferases